MRKLHRSGHKTTAWRERQESLSTATQLYLSTAINHMDGLLCVHIITLGYSCIAVLKVSHLLCHTAASQPNQHGTRMESEKLQVWMLPMLPMLPNATNALHWSGNNEQYTKIMLLLYDNIAIHSICKNWSNDGLSVLWFKISLEQLRQLTAYVEILFLKAAEYKRNDMVLNL